VIAQPFGLDREAQGYLMRTVKNLEQVIATQATKLAAFARPRRQFDASIAGTAFGTRHVRLSHGRKTISFHAMPAVHKLFTGLSK
jgi:hypothetical protein